MPLINGHKQRENDVSDAELKAVERNVLGGRRILWAGLAAVLAPLAMLMALQYWWLTELEHNSAIARKATLNNYLERHIHVSTKNQSQNHISKWSMKKRECQ